MCVCVCVCVVCACVCVCVCGELDYMYKLSTLKRSCLVLRPSHVCRVQYKNNFLNSLSELFFTPHAYIHVAEETAYTLLLPTIHVLSVRLTVQL